MPIHSASSIELAAWVRSLSSFFPIFPKLYPPKLHTWWVRLAAAQWLNEDTSQHKENSWQWPFSIHVSSNISVPMGI